MDRNIANKHAAESGGRRKAMSRRELLALIAMLGLGGTTEVAAQDAAKVNPRSYKVLFENDAVRVLEYNSRPGMGVCGVGKHSHPAHLVVSITGGKAKLTNEDGST